MNARRWVILAAVGVVLLATSLAPVSARESSLEAASLFETLDVDLAVGTEFNFYCAYVAANSEFVAVAEDVSVVGDSGTASHTLTRLGEGRGLVATAAVGDLRLGTRDGPTRNEDGFRLHYPTADQPLHLTLSWAIWHTYSFCYAWTSDQGVNSEVQIRKLDPSGARVAYAEDFATGTALELSRVGRAGSDLTLDAVTTGQTRYALDGAESGLEHMSYSVTDPAGAIRHSSTGLYEFDGQAGTRTFTVDGLQVAPRWPVLTLLDLPAL